jgi:hypothetical protein
MMFAQNEIRAIVHAAPFRPFRLLLADGKALRVPHPEFVLAGREQVVVATELPQETPGELNIVPYEHIVRLEFLSRRTRKAALSRSGRAQPKIYWLGNFLAEGDFHLRATARRFVSGIHHLEHRASIFARNERLFIFPDALDEMF